MVMLLLDAMECPVRTLLPWPSTPPPRVLVRDLAAGSPLARAPGTGRRGVDDQPALPARHRGRRRFARAGRPPDPGRRAAPAGDVRTPGETALHDPARAARGRRDRPRRLPARRLARFGLGRVSGGR